MTVVDALNGFAERGFDWAAASLVEAGLLLALAGLVLWLSGRRISPAAAHLLLLVVLVKAVLPLGIPAPESSCQSGASESPCWRRLHQRR